MMAAWARADGGASHGYPPPAGSASCCLCLSRLRCSVAGALQSCSLSPDTLIIQTIMDLIESDWAEMSHGQLKFVEIWRDRCWDNNGREQNQTLVTFTLKILYTID